MSKRSDIGLNGIQKHETYQTASFTVIHSMQSREIDNLEYISLNILLLIIHESENRRVERNKDIN